MEQFGLQAKAVMAVESNPPMWVLLLLLLTLLVVCYRKIVAAAQTKQLLPPGPPKLPVLGNLHQIGILPHQTFWNLSKKYGPVMLLHLGRIPAVVISSAEAAREVLSTHDLACCSRPLLAGTGKLSYNYRDVAFAPYGDKWRNMRKMIVLELFSSKRVQYFRFAREGEVDFLLRSVSESSSSSSATPVNLTEKLFALTANIVFRTVCGFDYKGTDFDKDRFHEVVHEAEVVVGSISAKEYLPYIGWIIDRISGHHARTERVFCELDNFFQYVIDDHLKPERKKEHDDMIDHFLRIEKEQAELGDSQFTTDNIKAVLVNMFLGGTDAAAITVNWAMAELLKKPRLMKRAQNEVRGCVGTKGRVTEDDIEQLEFLKMVVKETLRLHPPAPLLLPREVISRCTINGVNLYPKMLLYVNAWAIGRDPKYWKDPDEFHPERFVDSPIDFKGKNFEFLPFGGGRRGCPAMQMGIISVEIILANLLYCFDWELPDSMKPEDIDMEEKSRVSVTISKKIDLHLLPISFRK